jgi:hypothetical protein
VANRVVLDDLHLTVRISNKLSETQTKQIRQRLKSKGFMSQLRQAIQAVFMACPELAVVSLSVSR